MPRQASLPKNTLRRDSSTHRYKFQIPSESSLIGIGGEDPSKQEVPHLHSLRNNRTHSQHFHVDEEPNILESNINDSHLDMSYCLVIENVFGLLDTLFQRVKSHVKQVYDQCIEALESSQGSKSSEDASLRIKQ